MTPVRIIGGDEVSIGAGRHAQLLLPTPGEGDSQLLENLQIEDYIDAEGGSGRGSRSTMKPPSSSLAQSTIKKSIGNPTTTTTTATSSITPKTMTTAITQTTTTDDASAVEKVTTSTQAGSSTVRHTPTSLDPTPTSPECTLDESVTWLSNVVTTQKGRDAFISALNQFRSKKVEVGDGFSALGAVLWDLLDQCR